MTSSFKKVGLTVGLIVLVGGLLFGLIAYNNYLQTERDQRAFQREQAQTEIDKKEKAQEDYIKDLREGNLPTCKVVSESPYKEECTLPSN